jgi:hypothetical protein
MAAHRDDRAGSLACQRELVRYVDGELNEYVRNQRVRYTNIMVTIVREGVGTGVFDTADPVMTTLQVFGMCNYAWTGIGRTVQSRSRKSHRFSPRTSSGVSAPTTAPAAV